MLRQGMGSALSSSSPSRSSAKPPLLRTHTTKFLTPRAAPYALDSSSTLNGASSGPSVTDFHERWDSASSLSCPPSPGPFARAFRSAPRYVRRKRQHDPFQPKAMLTASCRPCPTGSGPSPAPVKRPSTLRKGKVVPMPPHSASATSATPISADQEVPYSSGDGLSVAVRRVRTLDELRQVATLRADAYYAENQSRFVGSLKKKFVEQEVESLQQRTSILTREGKPYAECLVAVDSSSGAVLACIDMRLPAALTGTHPHGVPQDDAHGCYLLNVVVREDVRGRGLGRGIMRAAMVRAVALWHAASLYTHVDADNEVAFGLYQSCGFIQHSHDARYEAASKLGQTVLLQAPAAAAQAA